jgi:ABC-type multidrug transport system ATPase subunit
MADSIRLQQLGRRFQRQWLFRGVEATFCKGDKVAVLGGNGSGKSSMTAMLAGFLSPSEGQIHWHMEGNVVPVEKWWNRVAWCSPALDMPLSLSITEVIDLYDQMRGYHTNWSKDAIIKSLELEAHLSKPMSQLSSGMRQRVKLMIAFALNADVLILDEPTAHLDARSIEWYKNRVANVHHHFIFIASNHDQDEIECCNKSIEIIPGGQALINHSQSLLDER